MTSKTLVLPTRNLARLVQRAVRDGKLPYNYFVGWVDVGGYGVHLAQVDWLPEGRTYINP